MYARYSYVAGATQADVLADLQALLTGTTDLNTLSASCNVALSEIYTDASLATWELFDAAAGTNKICLRTPLQDDPTKHMYVTLQVNAANVQVGLYESWNATTHVGTNKAFDSDNTDGQQTTNLTTGGQINISASPRHIALYGFQNNVYGNAGNSSPVMVSQRSRRTTWDTVANGYPPVVYIGAGYASCPRILNTAGTDSTQAAAQVGPWSAYFSGTPGGGSQAGGGFANLYNGGSSQNWNTTSALFSIKFGLGAIRNFSPLGLQLDENKMPSHALVPFGVIGDSAGSQNNYGFLGGEVSSASDMWLTTWAYGSPFDEMVANGQTYIIWSAYYARLAVRKG